MKIYKQLVSYQPIEVPYDVWRIIGGKKIESFGSLVCFDCEGQHDYVSLNEARHAIEYYVDQLGGKVTWESK